MNIYFSNTVHYNVAMPNSFAEFNVLQLI